MYTRQSFHGGRDVDCAWIGEPRPSALTSHPCAEPWYLLLTGGETEKGFSSSREGVPSTHGVAIIKRGSGGRWDHKRGFPRLRPRGRLEGKV